MARIFIERAELDLAQECLDELGEFERKDIYLDCCRKALTVLVDASLERVGEARRGIDTVSDAIFHSGMHPNILIDPVSILIRAALIVSEVDFAVDSAKWLIATNRIPANAPMCYYLYGEALRLSGNAVDAMEAYHVALDSKVKSRYSKFCETRLGRREMAA